MGMANATRAFKGGTEEHWEAMLARLEGQRELLRSQGCLARKGAAWCLRYYDRVPGKDRVQRTIYLGREDHLIERVRLWLEELRREEEMAKEGEILLSMARGITRVCRSVLKWRIR